ncbi:GNAT family N-acetyltransferase [Streptomyces sp. BI20]|uniref:GNAT family N-acetyltransferase n=1 Tax=Streptomyces sp. BI20 TaxID=3403460 RepID=UPI003C78799C
MTSDTTVRPLPDPHDAPAPHGSTLTAEATAAAADSGVGAVPVAPLAALPPASGEFASRPRRPWSIAAEDVHGAVAITLRGAYYAEVASRYWHRQITAAELAEGMAEPVDDLIPPVGTFLVGRLEGTPMACAGVRMLDADTAELTRVYVAPAARGTGGGSALLTRVEDSARALGATRVRLDTRTDLVEARALYARHGYEEIPAYNDSPYAQHFFEKHLS